MRDEVAAHQAMLRGIMDAATESILLLDREGTVLLANPTALRRLRRTAEEVVGRRTASFIAPEVNGPRMACIREVFDSGVLRVFQDERDGIHFHHSVCPVRDGQGRIAWVATFSRDVTAQRRAEEALSFSEEKFAKAFATTPAAIAMTTLEDGTFLDVNDTWVSLMGYGREEALGRSARKMNIWPDADAVARFTGELEARGSLTGWEQDFLTKSGESFVSQLSAQVLTVRGEQVVLSTFIDITSRKRTEEALRQAMERYEQQARLFHGVASTTPDFVYAFDLQGRFLYANQRLLEVWGIPLSQAVGKTCRELGYEQWHHDMHMAEIATVIETKRPIKGEVPFKAALTGIFGVYEYIFTPVIGPDGNIEFIAGTTRDITERKGAEETLRTAHDELELRVAERTAQLENAVRQLHEKEHMLVQQSRLAAMGEMISNIAHQWRQPLNSLGLIVQKLSLYHGSGELDPGLVEDSVEKSMMLIQHMSGTIDDFRNFFRPEKEKIQFRVKDVVSAAIKLVESAFNSRQIVIEVRQLDDPVVFGYPSEYSQVVLNVLSNAKDAFEGRGTTDPRIRLTLDSLNDRSLLTVADNAGGIDDAIMAKVFDPHFTTKETHGTGIGLFMCKNIIEKNMNGRISVCNNGEGAEFTIEV